MNNRFIIGLILILIFVLFGCNTEQKRLESFEGYVVEITNENGSGEIFVVDGISKKESIESNYNELKDSVDYKMRWFVIDGDLKGVSKGNKVTVWWDINQSHQVPKIPTLQAEKFSINEK